MADEKDVKATDGAPAVDIPDLKKKEKERKKAGAAWGSGKPAGSPFGGATGGAGAGARAAASAASSAAGTAVGAGSPAAFSGLSAWLSGVLATTFGKFAVGLGALLMVGGAGLVGLAMLRGGDAGGGGIIPDLGGLSSSLKIDRGGSDRTAITGKGDIRFDPVAAQKAAEKKEEKVEDKTAETPADTLEHGTINDTQGGLAGKDKLAHNLSGAKLTSQLGGSFGNKNIFGGAGSANAPKFSGGLAKSSLSIPKGKDGKLGAIKGRAQNARASKLNANRARTQRAFGQLKVARGLSAVGAGATSVDSARAGAADAFDQSASQGGTLDAPGGTSFDGAPANPGGGGGGAPDMTSVPDVPDVDGVRGDPRMDQAFKNIEKLAAAAGKLKMMGMMLMAIGAILIAIGAGMLPLPVGAILMAIGALLVGLGIMMMQQAAQMAAMAKQMGSMLANQYGTGTYQQQAVNECTDQVLANGGGGCNRPGPTPAPTTVQQDVEAERNTPVTIDGNGGPVQRQ